MASISKPCTSSFSMSTGSATTSSSLTTSTSTCAWKYPSGGSSGKERAAGRIRGQQERATLTDGARRSRDEVLLGQSVVINRDSAPPGCIERLGTSRGNLRSTCRTRPRRPAPSSAGSQPRPCGRGDRRRSAEVEPSPRRTIVNPERESTRFRYLRDLPQVTSTHGPSLDVTTSKGEAPPERVSLGIPR